MQTEIITIQTVSTPIKQKLLELATNNVAVLEQPGLESGAWHFPMRYIGKHDHY